MQELKDRILAEGEVIGTHILKVDTFLNHQIDPAFILRMGKELADRFAGAGITRVLTVEASGIAVASAVALSLNVPVVFAKKKQASTQSDVYTSQIYSFTRQESVNITVSKKFLPADDVVLIVDDFLAHGEALKGLVDIVRQSGAGLAGAGIVIEKLFQRGGAALRAEGMRIETLAAIERMEPGKIVFA
ncbi:xanthine phosphoribosyltransferase [Heliomicrobium modesticaldum Ice1]|uniref:Xanthine phosphoribosyltransferase n=1 Tax=Heliobacterium modesticaldum (strain ATCC 51547 / Ice1) TaxID=498761 RepID=XPT_HELMI|nr:xanthine phosphoribosyltransferase [Heliomicrobium modesticaldum]B0TCJ8.1 RecName: Full=Xanthine phosphoribosyltransferase; Short=XPRTase [Heliomicrobium modesticaldum Ice1]ABZ84024.1 xanthine phosphoribosyltransferase [Heliomicrobium modesticaldum Ice1]